MNDFLTPRSDNPIIRWWWLIDRTSFITIICLALFGVVMVATASPSVATRIELGSYHFLTRHIVFLFPALLLMVGLTTLNQKHIWRFAIILFVISIIGVVLSLISGTEIKGATRWIRLFGYSVQPSEFLKPSFILVSAWLLGRRAEKNNFPNMIFALFLYTISAGLLLLQPDFGMFFLITIIFGMQIFLVGCPLRYIVILCGICVGFIFIAYFSLGHVKVRIDKFLFPKAGDSYQIDLSKEAFMNGGFIGTGPGQGTIKNQVPDVHSDFIFTAMGEELGFLGTAGFVIILSMLFYRLLSRFIVSQSMFVILGGGGLVFMLIVQNAIHMGSTLQLIPAKGMTLPFISYGGSSLISVGLSFGLILALSRGLNEDRKRSAWRHLTNRGIHK